MANHHVDGNQPQSTLGELALALCDALDDSVTLLEGWINRHCPPRYRAEHMADVAKKRKIIGDVRRQLNAIAALSPPKGDAK